jgi:hypothetical protein
MKRKGRDPNDILREDGVDALREAFDSAKPFEPDNGPNKYVHNGNGGDTNQQQAERNSDRAQNKQAESSLGLPLTYFDDLSEKPTPKPWVIKNVIARDETSSWIAPPGRGKSALLTDLSIHVAVGMEWRGHRTKGRSGVVYFALERADLVRRRLIAHKQRDNHGALPIAVTGRIINLLDRKCVDTILATILEAEQHFGCKVGLAIFDTYSKGIAAGGGDEDKSSPHPCPEIRRTKPQRKQPYR